MTGVERGFVSQQDNIQTILGALDACTEDTKQDVVLAYLTRRTSPPRNLIAWARATAKWKRIETEKTQQESTNLWPNGEHSRPNDEVLQEKQRYHAPEQEQLVELEEVWDIEPAAITWATRGVKMSPTQKTRLRERIRVSHLPQFPVATVHGKRYWVMADGQRHKLACNHCHHLAYHYLATYCPDSRAFLVPFWRRDMLGEEIKAGHWGSGLTKSVDVYLSVCCQVPFTKVGRREKFDKK